MRSPFNPSNLNVFFAEEFASCRHKTLQLFHNMDAETFCCQAHPDFSPVGWHLGHIAYTESLWLLERGAGLPCLFPQYRQLFAADGLPKTERVQLPSLEEIYHYLEVVREKVFNYLETANLESEQRLWYFLLQHESQHCETISLVLELIKQQNGYQPQLPTDNTPILDHEFIKIPSGEFIMGNNSIHVLDNESPAHTVYLDTYYIDRYPVTCGQYRLFIEAGGYENSQFWSELGWQWRQAENIQQPLYWQENYTCNNHPVYGVSWYEAQAYCQFVGKRLPTEAEWEKAVSWDAENNLHQQYPWGNEDITVRHCNYDNQIGITTAVDAYPWGKSPYGLFDALGNVWEWTNSWFDGYSGFEYYPYQGYSQVYFDNQHRVLKGGSWVTRPWALRSSFRNWYHPGVRQILAGFRCATS